MNNSQNPNNEQTPNLPPDSNLLGGYPPPSSHSMDNLPQIGNSSNYSTSQGMDRFLTKILTFLGIIAVFILFVVLLRNISPDSNESIDINAGTSEINEELDTDILGE